MQFSYYYRKIKSAMLGLLLASCLLSCKKYLDKKSDKSLATISTVADCQALLDQDANMNWNYAGLQQVVGDEFYLPYTSWLATDPIFRANHVWDATTPAFSTQWQVLYKIPYLSNVVLAELPKVSDAKSNAAIYNNVRGQALFFRSFAFYEVAQLWAKPYSSNTATSDPGIPTRTLPDPEVASERGTVQQTYDQIISDMKEAAALLPNLTVAYTRPSKAAAFGALSRVYLSMREYDKAGKYADSALQLFNTLLDFNTLDSTKAYPVPVTNSEVLFYAIAPYGLTGSTSLIDSNLYSVFGANDLRKSIFFLNSSGNISFKGFHIGAPVVFQGIATDELYLNRAECYARTGQKDAAMTDLNTLLVKRWKAGTFTPLTATDATDALNKVLTERRKELIYRGIRWTDLRRYNLDGANITLKRVINGTTYTLPPNDLRWVLLIPQDVIDRTTMQQNPR